LLGGCEVFPAHAPGKPNVHTVNFFTGVVVSEQCQESLRDTLDSQHDDLKWVPVDSAELHPFVEARVHMLRPKLKAACGIIAQKVLSLPESEDSPCHFAVCA